MLCFLFYMLLQVLFTVLKCKYIYVQVYVLKYVNVMKSIMAHQWHHKKKNKRRENVNIQEEKLTKKKKKVYKTK